MKAILYAIPIFLITIAFEYWWAQRFRGNQIQDAGGRTRQIYNFSDTVGSLHTGMLSRITLSFFRLLTYGIYILVFNQFAVFHWDLQSPLAYVVALILYDHSYYWSHRSRHEIRILWATHITHHNSEYFNLSTALRQASSGALFDWIFYLPLALVGIPWQMLLVVSLIDLLYQYWVHTELIGKLGWFDRVFVSPSNHRVHHGQNDYCIDKNYGGILILWDRLYGSFVEERNEPVVYGVRTTLANFDPIWTNLHYFHAIWLDFKSAKGLANKLEAIFAPTSGWDGEKLAAEHFVPESFKRFTVEYSAGILWYGFSQLVINVFLVVGFLYKFPTWNQGQAIVAGIWLMAAFSGPVALIQSRSWAKKLEVARWLLFIPLAIWLSGVGQ